MIRAGKPHGPQSPGWEGLHNAVEWPGAVRVFHTVNHPSSCGETGNETGVWRVLVVVDSHRDAAKQLGLSHHDRQVWGTGDWLARVVSEQTGLDVRVRMVNWDRWWSLRRVAGTFEHECFAHGRWLVKPSRRRHRIADEGKGKATCRHCVDLGHERWPSTLQSARGFAAVRVLEPGADKVEMVLWGMNASAHTRKGFDRKHLKTLHDRLFDALRCFLMGSLVLCSIPYRPAGEPTIVELFDLLPAQFDRGNITREHMELFHFWKRIRREPTRDTVRRLGCVTVDMMGLVAQQVRRNKDREGELFDWMLGHFAEGRDRLRRTLALPRWSDPQWFSLRADPETVRRAAEQLLPAGVIEYIPKGVSSSHLVVVGDDTPHLLRHSEGKRLMDVVEEATGLVIPVRIVGAQTWANNAAHPLAWEHHAAQTGTWITSPPVQVQPLPHEQVCVERTIKALSKASSMVSRAAYGYTPRPRETDSVTRDDMREYWDALVERLRQHQKSMADLREGIDKTRAEMNETPGYQPTTSPKTAEYSPPTNGDHLDPPLVANVRETTLETMLSCQALVTEIVEYAQQTDTSTERFARSLETIRESSQCIAERLDGLRWVYPDGTPPRGWDPYYLNNQKVRHEDPDTPPSSQRRKAK